MIYPEVNLNNQTFVGGGRESSPSGFRKPKRLPWGFPVVGPEDVMLLGPVVLRVSSAMTVLRAPRAAPSMRRGYKGAPGGEQ